MISFIISANVDFNNCLIRKFHILDVVILNDKTNINYPDLKACLESYKVLNNMIASIYDSC